jgi:hypothetical protein
MNGTATSWIIQALCEAFAGLSEAKRNALAGRLGIQPQFHVQFVEAEDGRPKGENDAS